MPRDTHSKESSERMEVTIAFNFDGNRSDLAGVLNTLAGVQRNNPRISGGRLVSTKRTLTTVEVIETSES